MEKIFDLAKFDKYKEDNRREVKSAKGGLPNSLWETYSAMANTYGGVIILGVKEDENGAWQTTGLSDVSKLKKDFWSQINDNKKVSVNLLQESDVSVYSAGGDAIFVIKVPAADREIKPVFLNGDMFRQTYKRNNEGDYHCTEAEVRAMLRDQPRKTMDMKVLPQMKISDFNRESIEHYKILLDSKRPGHVFLSLSQDKFLEAIGAAKETEDGTLHPTCAGLLMFGMEHKILYEYNLYFLDYREHLLPEVRWTDRIQSQSGDWSGNVFDFFARVAAKLVLDLKRPFKLENMVRVDETPMYGAVREALVNCLVNTDFFEPRGVVIDKYPEKIVFRNPGTSIVGKKQMLWGGESEPRNSGIMKMFNLIGFGERAGSGVPDIYAVWQNMGLLEPTVEERFGNGEPNRTIVTLPLTAKGSVLVSSGQPENNQKTTRKQPENNLKNMEERLKGVIDLIRDNPSISRTAMAAELELTEAQIKTAINILKSRKIICHEGPAKGGKWIIK